MPGTRLNLIGTISMEPPNHTTNIYIIKWFQGGWDGEVGCGVCGLGLRGCPVSQYAKFIYLICKKIEARLSTTRQIIFSWKISGKKT